MDFRNLLGTLNQLNEDVEVVAEKATSQAQQKAAGAALAAKRGDIPKSELTGASKEMLDMSEKDLEDFAGTKHKDIPKKKEESFDSAAFRKSFEAMVEAKSKKPNDGNLANNAKPYDKITRADVIAGATGNDEMGGKKKKKKADESVQEGSLSRKFMKAMSFGPQTDSPKDMRDGISKMSDKELLDLMRGDDFEAPSGSARSLQQKLLKREIKRRGIGESGDLGEGKSKHPKGSKKYKDQMAAKHANMNDDINESFEKFFAGDKLTFEEAVKIVRESGGQQKIDPVDTALWNWAQRVAANKFTESRKAEMFAGLIYERNGGEFQIHDVLSED